MRLAEAFLTRAECNQRLSTAIGRLRCRCKPDTAGWLTTSGECHITTDTDERELELAFEGQGLWDAKRLRLTVDGNHGMIIK
jgi:hypothetical protein